MGYDVIIKKHIGKKKNYYTVHLLLNGEYLRLYGKYSNKKRAKEVAEKLSKMFVWYSLGLRGWNTPLTSCLSSSESEELLDERMRGEGKVRHMKEINNFLGIIGVGIAILAPLLEFLNVATIAWAVWVIATCGLVMGLSIKSVDVKLLLSSLILLSVASFFAIVPYFGTLLNNIFKNIGIFAGSILAVPALRVVLNRFGFKI